jgi:RimJ/RimL family protein N-acetyltransferase
MPKMPSSRPPLMTPLAAQKLKPVIVDKREGKVRLKTMVPADVTPEVARWLTDPAVMEGLNAPKEAMGLDAFRAYVASFDQLRRNLMLVTLQPDDRPVGLLFLEIDLRHKIGSLHFIIGEEGERGNGLATAACIMAIQNFFIDRGMEKLTFQPLERNNTAIAVCEKYKLRLEGIMRSHRIDGRTGERLDQRVYGLTKVEFFDRVAEAANALAARSAS